MPARHAAAIPSPRFNSHHQPRPCGPASPAPEIDTALLILTRRNPSGFLSQPSGPRFQHIIAKTVRPVQLGNRLFSVPGANRTRRAISLREFHPSPPERGQVATEAHVHGSRTLYHATSSSATVGAVSMLRATRRIPIPRPRPFAPLLRPGSVRLLLMVRTRHPEISERGSRGCGVRREHLVLIFPRMFALPWIQHSTYMKDCLRQCHAPTSTGRLVPMPATAAAAASTSPCSSNSRFYPSCPCA